MSNFAASFDTQLSPVAPFLFYLVIGVIIFIETGLLIGFFLPGDSLLFSAGLVAAAGGGGGRVRSFTCSSCWLGGGGGAMVGSSARLEDEASVTAPFSSAISSMVTRAVG